jgi:ATP/ADP translocase
MSEPREHRPHPAVLDRILAPFAVLRPGEGKDALLLTLAVFLLLTAYYILKVVREPLILSAGGAELKSYTSAAQAVLLLFLIPAYGAIANRVNRIKLISIVTVFFISNLFVFYAMAIANTPYLGVAYFIWVGIFNLMIIAQFWSFANDVYTPEEGKRLFAIVGFGQTLGATCGGLLSKLLIGRLRVHELLIFPAALLLGYLLIIRIVHHRDRSESRQSAMKAEQPMLDRRGGFTLVARDRYLLLIAVLLLVLNFVNTNGEYIPGARGDGRSASVGRCGRHQWNARRRLRETVHRQVLRRLLHVGQCPDRVHPDFSSVAHHDAFRRARRTLRAAHRGLRCVRHHRLRTDPGLDSIVEDRREFARLLAQ